MEQPHAEEIGKAIERAQRKVPKDYSEVLPFMARPVETKYHRTNPELAYKAMGKAIEGLSPRELRDLARHIEQWKHCESHGRRIVQEVAIWYAEEAHWNRVRREIEERMNRLHPVIDFATWSKRHRKAQARTSSSTVAGVAQPGAC